LGDAERRRRFDAGLIDADGAERAEQQFYREHAGQGAGFGAGGFGGASQEDLGEIFSSIFRGGGPFGATGVNGGRRGPMRGEDVAYQLAVDFVEAIKGAKKRVTMPDGKALDLKIPAGVKDGQSLRLQGKGRQGANGGPSGDALVNITVRPDKSFSRDGDNLRSVLAVTLPELVLGAKVDAPTVDGAVKVTIHPNTNNGAVLRLKGKGVAGKGDQFVELKLVLPQKADDEFKAFLEDWSAGKDHQPRK
jgi:DnaJ-class molecular chaperone